MFIYEFETVECSASGYSLFGGVGLAMEGYQDIIRRRGREGLALRRLRPGDAAGRGLHRQHRPGI